MSVDRRMADLRARMQAILGEDTRSVPARQRIAGLLDSGSFVELDMLMGQGVITGFGTVEQRPVYLYAQDVTVDHGAMGEGHARKILRVMDMALSAGAPLVAICDSPGAKLLEGATAQAAYARIFTGHAKLSGAVPQIAIVSGNCIASQAVAARMCDFVIMSEDGYMNHLPPQVIAAKRGADVVRSELGGGKVSVQNGNADFAFDDELSALLAARYIIGLLPANNQEDAVIEPEDDLNRLIAYDMTRVDAREIIAPIADGNIVMQAGEGFAPNCVTALIRLGGRTVGIIAAQDLWDEDATFKAARFVRKIDAFNIPIISLMNIEGIKDPENQNTVRALAQLGFAYAAATVPKISLVVGRAYGPIYSAIGARPSADMVLAWPLATISPMRPDAAVEMLYEEEMKKTPEIARARAEAIDKFTAGPASALTAAEKGVVDGICEVEDTRKTLIYMVDMFSAKRIIEAPRKHGSI